MIIGYDESPEHVIVMLRRKGIKPKLYVSGPLPKNNNVVFFTFEAFERHNVECRRSYKTYHVCGDRLALARYNIEVSTLYDQTECIPRIIPKRTLTKSLIDKVKKGSLFGDLMTHIYTLPSKSVQRPVTDLCCRYLNSHFNFDELEKQISHKITRESPRLILLKIMQRPIADKLREALKSVREGMDIEDASKQFGVQLFEITYVLGNINKKANCTDKYVQNQGLE